MKSLVRFTICVFVLWLVVFPAHGAFTSLCIFGDGVSTTTNGPGGSLYYNFNGQRYCNGRVWVEVLAERQGLTYESNKNWSYFGHYSTDLVTNVNNFTAPPDANTALFVVWVNNADFVFDVQNYSPYTTNNIAAWTNAINQSLTNHFKAITNFYAKGVRTLIMPKAVDITRAPQYIGLSVISKSFIRQRIIDFNSAFAVKVSDAAAALPGLTIHVPDMFTLFDDVVVQHTNYGFTNAVSDAIDDGYTALNGPGTNYVFWDYLHPTAKVQAVIADNVQQLISPVQISKIASLGGSNRLDMANIPIGRDGFVDGSTDLVNWASEADINSTNATQTIFVPVNGPLRFYRLRFPFSWSWP